MIKGTEMSHDLSAICELKTQEHQWFDWAWGQKPEEPKAQSKSRSRHDEMPQLN